MKEKESDVNEVHEMAFREGERLAGESADALPEREIEALDVVGFSLLFGTRSVLVVGHHLLVGLPEVGEDEAGFVSVGDLLPQLAAAEHGAGAMMPSDHLPGAAAQRDPQPERVLLAAHKRPHLVQLQHLALLCGHKFGLHPLQRRGATPQVTVFF